MKSQLFQNKRKERDIMKLVMSNYEVSIPDENNKNDMYVKFHGPKDSPYEGGIWKVHVLLPEQYPYKSPSIGFYNKIYHPNVDENSGSICLDVINQTWSPMFDLINIFDEFLPQLLLYPNPTDPLNGDAAKLLQSDPEKYNLKIKDYVKKFASENDIFDKKKLDENNINNNINNNVNSNNIRNCNNSNNNNTENDIKSFDDNNGKKHKNKKIDKGIICKDKNININEDVDDENNDDLKSIASSILSKPSIASLNSDD